MVLLIKERQSGKTTGLIYASEATGYPIATVNECMVKAIEEKAKQMGCIIPQPVTFDDLRRGFPNRDILYENVLADEIGFIIGRALNEYLGCNVKCATMSDNLKEMGQ